MPWPQEWGDNNERGVAWSLAMKVFKGFTSDYPGIRHSGNPANALRDIEMRDMVAVSILLAGFTPYLSDNLDSNRVYSGD